MLYVVCYDVTYHTSLITLRYTSVADYYFARRHIVAPYYAPDPKYTNRYLKCSTEGRGRDYVTRHMTRGTEEIAGWSRTVSHLCNGQWRYGEIILCGQWDQGVKLTIHLRALSKIWKRGSPITLHGTVISSAEKQPLHTTAATMKSAPTAHTI
jgi:hypothetical protein